MKITSTNKSRAKRSFMPLAVITLAHLMAVFDNTIMIVALPVLQMSLKISAVDRQWIITAYTLAYAGLLLLGGRLADRFGAKRTLIVGVIGFALASAVGGLSQSFAMLVVARAIGGAFGAILTSSTKTLLALTYTEKQQRAKAMGVFGATLAMGSVLGMALGGLIIGTLGWRWCFFINLPISIFIISFGLKALLRVPAKKQVHIDLTSAAIFSISIIALVYGLGGAADNGWGTPIVVGSIATCVISAITFIIMQQRKIHPLLPLRILRDRLRGGALLASIFDSFGTLGLMLILTFQLQKVQGFTAFETGLTLIPLMLATTILSAFVAPRLMCKVAPVWLITGDVVFSGLGLLTLAFLQAGAWFWPVLILAEILEGVGTGLGTAPTMHTSLIGIEPEDVGIVSSASSATSQMGSSIGTALLNTIAVSVVGVAATGSIMGYGFAIACGYGGVLLLVVSVIVFMIMGSPSAKRRVFTKVS